MTKLFKTLLCTIAALVLVVVLAISALVLFIDPNQYKTVIEEQAKTKAGVNLKLNGELSWSIWPLGIHIADVALNDRSDQHFAKLGLLTAQVDVLSLLAMKPVVHHVLIEALDLRLLKDQDGKGNWENLVDQSLLNQTEPATPAPEAEPDANQTPIELLVKTVQIKDAAVQFTDLQSGQDVALNPFNLRLSNIALDQDIPVDLSFTVALKEPELKLDFKLDTQVNIASNFKQFALKNADAQATVIAALLQNKALNSRLKLDVAIDLDQQTVNVANYDVTLNNMKAGGQVKVSQLDTTPLVDASLDIAEFSLAELLASLGIALPPMQDNAALSKFALSLQANTDTKELTLDKLTLKLDDSTFTGSVFHRMENQYSKVNLNGDTINLNRFLPPVTDTPTPAPAPTSQNKEPIKIDLPDDPIDLAPLRKLALDAEISMDKVLAKEISAEKVHLKLHAQNGLITLDDLSSQLLGGSIAINATADARGDVLKVKLDQKAKDISADMDLGEFIYQFALQGKTNLNTALTTQGSSIKTLADNVKLQSDFSMIDGKILGANAAALTCEGIALVNGQSISTSKWIKETEFDQLNGSVTMNGLDSGNTVTLQAAKMKLQGDGKIDLNRMLLDYTLTTYILGDLGHEACRYNPKFANIGIPIKCKGDLNGIDATFCLPDKDRIGEMAKDLLKQEASRKATKEVDRALDKHLGGGDSETKDAVKGLLKKLF